MQTLTRLQLERPGKYGLICPKCRTLMLRAYENGVDVAVCDTCRGMWVEHGQESDVIGIPARQQTVDEILRLRRLYRPWGKVDRSGYVPCPVCQDLMHRKNWGSHSGVIVDRCSAHGTWYDAGELEKVRDFVNHAGIEYEKLGLIESGLASLDTKFTEKFRAIEKKLNPVRRRRLR